MKLAAYKRVPKWGVRTAIIYLFGVMVWTPFVLSVFYPHLVSLLIPDGSSQWRQAGVYFFLQTFASMLIPCLMWLFVARPAKLTPLIDTDRRAHRIAVLIAVILFVILMTPLSVLSTPWVIVGVKLWMTGLAEEWQYRGMMTRIGKQSLGLIWAIVIVSCLFGVSHWAEIAIYEHISLMTIQAWVQIASDVLAGLLFSLIYWRSRSLLWVAVVHGYVDWQPWTLASGRPWPHDGIVAALAGIVGAEVIRRFWVVRSSQAKRLGLDATSNQKNI